MKKTLSTVWLLLFLLTITVFSVSAQDARPPRVSTSVGIFDVQSREDIHKFSAREIRQLVELENGRSQSVRTVPHPVLVYCFEERTFRYTGGRFQDEEITYRLRTPRKVRFWRRYPLIVHLHGAGDDSLVHLHSILPLMIGPNQQDFFMLVVQAPRTGEGRGWQFRSTKDGSLDIVVAALEHVLENNPIDRRRITLTGISAGGSGAWQLMLRYPDKFAGAVPTACNSPSPSQHLTALTRTPIWQFVYEGDRRINAEAIQETMHVVNSSGGSMALTQIEGRGHNAWRPAIDTYDCFRWALAQKRGSWFAPPPGVAVYKPPHSALFAIILYILPISIIVFLLWETICGWASLISQKVSGLVGKL